MSRTLERWDLWNIGAVYSCYPKAKRAALQVAAIRKIPIMIRYLGPRRDLADPTRVNQYAMPDGTIYWKRDREWYVDVDP